MIKVFTTSEELDQIRPLWDALFSGSEEVTPFQSFAYCRAALPLLSGQLHVVGWYRKNELLALFPFYVDTKRRLRFINDSHSDFCGPLVSPSAVGDFHMCEELAEHIRECREIRRVRLENMRFDLFQSSLQYQMKGSLLYGYKQFSYFVLPFCENSRSAIDSLSHLSTKEKYRLKNIASKKENAGAQWRCFDMVRSDEWPQKLIRELTSSMISAGIRKKKYFNDDFLTFVKNVYESGQMMVSATYLGGNPVSCNLYLKNGTEFIDWMAYYVEPHYNSWNLLDFIEYLHGCGGGTLNFARGIYPYKMHNYKPSVGSLSRLHWSKSRIARIADLLDSWIAQAKRMKRTR